MRSDNFTFKMYLVTTVTQVGFRESFENNSWIRHGVVSFLIYSVPGALVTRMSDPLPGYSYGSCVNK